MFECDKCGKLIRNNNGFEVEIHEDETPESVIKEVKVICEDCFEELGASWIGF